jgi:frataxin-like iron-binding protein CyaY
MLRTIRVVSAMARRAASVSAPTPRFLLGSAAAAREFSEGPKPLTRESSDGPKPLTRKKSAVVDDAAAVKAANAKPFDFRGKAKEFMTSTKAALESMQEVNEPFNVTFFGDKLVIDLGKKGEYILTTDYEMLMITCQTPVSGKFAYYYDLDNNTWLNKDDDHDVRGLITRDMMRQNLLGVPKFE